MDFEESSSCCFYKCVAKIVQGEANETCFKLVSRSLSSAKVRRLLCHIATQAEGKTRRIKGKLAEKRQIFQPIFNISAENSKSIK